MGVDIFWVFQTQEKSKWIDIPSKYEGQRDCHLYGWLGAGDRSIVKARGFPSDFLIDDINRHSLVGSGVLGPCEKERFSGKVDDLYRFMGEWGFSWLLGHEIINASIPVVRMKIWMPVDVYNEWDKVSNPEHWHELHSDWQKHECSERYATPESITKDTWWVIVDWLYDFTEDFQYFIGEVRRLMAIYGEIRFVFGFA